MIASLLTSVAGGLIVFWASARFPSMATTARGTLAGVVGALVLAACLLALRRKRQADGAVGRIAVGSDSQVRGTLTVSETEIHAPGDQSVSVGSGNKVGRDMNVGPTKITR